MSEVTANARRQLRFACLSDWLLYGIAAAPLALVLLSVGVIVWISFAAGPNSGLAGPYTAHFYELLFSDPLIVATVLNTFGFCAIAAMTAMTIGITLSWFVECTDMPGKRAAYSIMTATLLLPTFFQAMGWLFFLHPRIGMLNVWLSQTFGVPSGTISIANIVGMGWVEGLGLAPLAFVMTGPLLRAMNPALDDAARVHGLGRWVTLSRILLPLIWPGILATGIYIAVIGTATFEVPAIIGLGSKILTYSTYIYINVTPEMGAPSYGAVGALSMPMILLSLVLSWLYFRVVKQTQRYAVVQGRAYRRRLVGLGRWRWTGWFALGFYSTLAVVLPLVMMIWAAFLPYFQPFSANALRQVSFANFRNLPYELLLKGFANSLILVAAVPAAALVLGLAISWIVVRSRSRGRFVFDWLAFLPHAIPSVIFAVAMVLVALFIVPHRLPFYGTISIIFVVYVLVRLSFTTRVLNGALLQIHGELEESAHVNGLPFLVTIWKVLLPLLKPAIVSLCLWNALLTFRELTMAAFLVTQNNITLPVVVWGIWQAGSLSKAAAAAVVFFVVFLPAMVLYWYIVARFPDESALRQARP
jgi:iron(III) transport system permease protein